ncbi:hypothetical protein [Paenibacillus glycanilyticus]|uniref:hypothetical protein n=1 Tax=Paenibacillus glycanilyticus TaxID=126569 RepID=UPI0015812426|nr:hypothetical protein [Paenibacillus glycanilyticus]
MKYDWKKNDKPLYLPKNSPSVIEVPAMNYFMLNGKGNPNHPEFAEAVGVLYSLSYTVKMLSPGLYLFRLLLPSKSLNKIVNEAFRRQRQTLRS